MSVVLISSEAGHIATIIMMAVALGMDAFSLGIGIGIRGIRLYDILKLSFIIASFHVIMPLLGMFTGHYVSSLLGDIAVLTGGGLLLLLGAHMVYSSFKGENIHSFEHATLWGLIIFALSVSIDSFSVGISLGLFSSDLMLTVLMFGFFGGVMSVMGLVLGKKVAPSMGDYGEALGGLILVVFGLKVLF